MRLSSIDFEGCGFPEEYVFVCAIFLAAAIMTSFVLLHFLINEEYFEKKIRLPVVFYLFNPKAFTRLGNIVRTISAVSVFAMILLMTSTYYLFKYGIYTCGQLN